MDLSNKAIIICMIVIFLGFVGWLLFRYINEKKLQKVNFNIREFLETLSYVAIILTLAYGVFSYTYNIYPTFEKVDEFTQLKNHNVQLTDENKKLKDHNESLASSNLELAAHYEEVNLQLEKVKSERDAAVSESNSYEHTIAFQKDRINALVNSYVFEYSYEIIKNALNEQFYESFYSEGDTTFADRVLSKLQFFSLQQNSISSYVDSYIRKFVELLPSEYANATTYFDDSDFLSYFFNLFPQRFWLSPFVFDQNLSDYLEYDFSLNYSYDNWLDNEEQE